MNAQIQIFNSSQFGEIRTATTENGEPLFCLVDLCNALNLSNATVVAQRLDEDEVTKLNLGSKAGETNFVTEGGMYTAILRSSNPMAKPFRKWVTSEVLPAIRKSGGYIHATESDTPELIMARALIVAQEAIEKHKSTLKVLEAEKDLYRSISDHQAKELKESAPKVQYHDEVLQSQTGITTNVIAKELGMSAITLNKKLHALGVIYLQAGTWLLYAKHQNRGYTKTKTHVFTDNHGIQQTSILTVWTEKGRQMIRAMISQPVK